MVRQKHQLYDPHAPYKGNDGVYRWYCDSATTRQGELEPCGKPAVTWMDPEPWRDEYGDVSPWPVCAYHAHMGTALPLHLHPERTDR